MRLIKDNIDLTSYMPDDSEVSNIRPASNWMEEVIDHFHNPVTTERGSTLPWHKTRQDFHFRPGEVSIWAGINGHGKSQILGQVELYLMEQQERVCLASLEMKPFRTMARMSRQAAGKDEPNIGFLKSLGKWTDGKLWIYDKMGNAKPKTMLALIRYAVDKFQITHFVVDNMTKVVAGEDDYNGQKDFVNSICTLAADLNIHIHIVMHIRKGDDEDKIPNKMGIKGAGSITDMVDNVFIVWRNKSKERKIQAGDMSDLEKPDCILVLDKQRNGETEGRYNFWFHPASFQYLESYQATPQAINISTY